MKDRILYLIIGILFGIVIMQWTIPCGRASIVTTPAGNVVSVAHEFVITADGHLWMFRPQVHVGPEWSDQGILPMPYSDIKFFTYVPGSIFAARIIDSNGQMWCNTGYDTWENCGQPPQSVNTEQRTFGKIKSFYKDD